MIGQLHEVMLEEGSLPESDLALSCEEKDDELQVEEKEKLFQKSDQTGTKEPMWVSASFISYT